MSPDCLSAWDWFENKGFYCRRIKERKTLLGIFILSKELLLIKRTALGVRREQLNKKHLPDRGRDRSHRLCHWLSQGKLAKMSRECTCFQEKDKEDGTKTCIFLHLFSWRSLSLLKLKQRDSKDTNTASHVNSRKTKDKVLLDDDYRLLLMEFLVIPSSLSFSSLLFLHLSKYQEKSQKGRSWDSLTGERKTSGDKTMSCPLVLFIQEHRGFRPRDSFSEQENVSAGKC